jgi:hypothetical protein
MSKLQDNQTSDIRKNQVIAEPFSYNEQQQFSKRLFFTTCDFKDSQDSTIASADQSMKVYDGGVKQDEEMIEVGLILDGLSLTKPANGANNAFISLWGVIALTNEGYKELGNNFLDGYKIAIDGENDQQVMKQNNAWGKFFSLDEPLELEYSSSRSFIQTPELIDEDSDSSADVKRYRFGLDNFKILNDKVTFVGGSDPEEHIVVTTNNLK